ncbi:hypothetical protein AKJ56_01695 [candidate division MSBL1 archaeon SCGC-AAA382N08]|uniref:Sulfotransferase domain-containing protein n=1 Tax=candidate division MSBL1 archaeon SCGC-AAA382N08 TaxID=1698285 RepID=A0A133VP41_9EURY|nr:hypothetical protein AKJ56_01695 [candidate division MSBL1 archaeon SCGC-AAA382N08]
MEGIMNDNFKVDFFGISPPRCATTWMYKNLKKHPEICMSSKGETCYFGKWKYEKGLDFYAGFFDYCEPNQIKGDSTPTYFSQEGVAERIKRHNPEAKFYVCLRHPIERTWSHYLHQRSQGLRAALFDFDEAMEEMWDYYIKPSKYYTCLKEYLDRFPRENILILTFDDLKDDPLDFLQSIFEFLEVSPEFEPEGFDKKVNPFKKREIKHGRLLRWGWKVENFLRVRQDKSLVGPLYKFLKKGGAGAWRKVREDFLKGSAKQKEGKKPALDEDKIQELKEIFNPEIEKVEQLIDKDLSSWKNYE